MIGRRSAGRVAVVAGVVATVGVLGALAVELGAVLAVGRAAAVGTAAGGAVESVARDPGPPVAVMVLGGDRERVTTALALPGVATGARTLVASADAARDLVELGGNCDAPGVLCVEPAPATTRGEAGLAADLVAARGWDRLVVVTSWWHVRRASLHLAACLDVLVVMVGSGDPAALPPPWRLLEETVGGLDARLRPECRDRRQLVPLS